MFFSQQDNDVFATFYDLIVFEIILQESITKFKADLYDVWYDKAVFDKLEQRPEFV